MLSGEPPEPPTITSVAPDSIAAAACDRGELAVGLSLLTVNGHPVYGHEEGTAALVGVRGHAVLQLRATAAVELPRAAQAMATSGRSQLASLLGRLLERDATQRLATHEAVRAHPFFEPVDWALLAAQELPAPFLPSPQLVYAKDHTPGLSERDIGKKRHSDAVRKSTGLPELVLHEAADDEASGVGGGWSHVPSRAAYAVELAEYVCKSTTTDLVRRERQQRRARTASGGHGTRERDEADPDDGLSLDGSETTVSEDEGGRSGLVVDAVVDSPTESPLQARAGTDA